jgi:hypothetical protein
MQLGCVPQIAILCLIFVLPRDDRRLFPLPKVLLRSARAHATIAISALRDGTRGLQMLKDLGRTSSRHERAFRDTTVHINIQGTLAIVPWLPMMVGTLAT